MVTIHVSGEVGAMSLWYAEPGGSVSVWNGAKVVLLAASPARLTDQRVTVAVGSPPTGTVAGSGSRIV